MGKKWSSSGDHELADAMYARINGSGWMMMDERDLWRNTKEAIFVLTYF